MKKELNQSDFVSVDANKSNNKGTPIRLPGSDETKNAFDVLKIQFQNFSILFFIFY